MINTLLHPKLGILAPSGTIFTLHEINGRKSSSLCLHEPTASPAAYKHKSWVCMARRSHGSAVSTPASIYAPNRHSFYSQRPEACASNHGFWTQVDLNRPICIEKLKNAEPSGTKQTPTGFIHTVQRRLTARRAGCVLLLRDGAPRQTTP